MYPSELLTIGKRAVGAIRDRHCGYSDFTVTVKSSIKYGKITELSMESYAVLTADLSHHPTWRFMPWFGKHWQKRTLTAISLFLTKHEKARPQITPPDVANSIGRWARNQVGLWLSVYGRFMT